MLFIPLYNLINCMIASTQCSNPGIACLLYWSVIKLPEGQATGVAAVIVVQTDVAVVVVVFSVVYFHIAVVHFEV